MRENIDNYFLRIVEVIGSRGTCNRGKSGCIIVKDKQIISTGYVGAPSGTEHCDTVGHQLVDNHCLRSTHAEQNAIINAARNGVSTEGSTLYCTMFPCYSCAKMIINAGITNVVCDYDYQSSFQSKEIFNEVNIFWSLIHSDLKKYE